MSNRDYRTHKMSKTEALKTVKKIMNGKNPVIMTSRHAEDQMKTRGVFSTDALNVLKSPAAKVQEEGELVNGTYRYRVKTNNYVVVVSFFKNADGITIVTVWQIERKAK